MPCPNGHEHPTFTDGSHLRAAKGIERNETPVPKWQPFLEELAADHFGMGSA